MALTNTFELYLPFLSVKEKNQLTCRWEWDSNNESGLGDSTPASQPAVQTIVVEAKLFMLAFIINKNDTAILKLQEKRNFDFCFYKKKKANI